MGDNNSGAGGNGRECVLYTRSLMQSVSDFLSANRSAGRYIVSFSQGMAQLGSITIVGMFEMNYIAGFTLRWWEYANGIVILLVTISGWVIYRFRANPRPYNGSVP